MNIKDSYLHSGTHLVKNISFSADSGVVKATITWAQEGAENTVIDLPTVGGAQFGSQTANYVFAAPNGSNGNPSFRALDAADIPDIGADKITSGELSADRLPWALTTAKGAVKVHTVDSTTNVTGKQYWVNRNANGELYVAVPWDTNTHYTAVPVLGASNATSNATSDTTNASTYLNIIEDSTKSGGIQITGAGGASVKAKSGVLTITSTWKAANSTQEGYAPKLVSGGTALASSANDYVLAFTYSSSGTLTPSWKKLPANAYLNNTYDVYNGTYSIKSKVGDTVTTVSDFTANQNDADDFTIIQGDNITLTSDTTNRTLTIAANAVNSTQSGVAPQLANEGTELEDSTNDYVLAFTYASSGTLVPSWKKLPANAYLDTWIQFVGATSESNGTAGYLPAPGIANISKFLKGDGSWDDPYFAIEYLTDWAQVDTSLVASSITFPKVWWKITPTSSNQVYGIGIHPTNGLLYYIYNNKGTKSATAYSGNTNTWRGIYVDGTSKAGTGTGTYAMNFVSGNNITVTHVARGTASSGSNSYFNIKIDAVDTTYTLKVGTSDNLVTVLDGTSTVSGTIITNSAYDASTNKIATMLDINNATTSIFKFQNNTNALPTGTQKVGYAYRVNAVFTLLAANSASGSDEVLEPGDLLICTDATTPKYLVLNTNWTVTNNAPTLGTSATTIATVGGVAITASLPAAARGTAGIISLPTGSTTVKFLREDGQWVTPAYTVNTDKTTIYKDTVSGTKKTDTTKITANSSDGLIFEGGTNLIKIGDGTNYIEIPITPSIDSNITGTGTNNYLVKWTGTNTIGNLIQLSSIISSQTQSTKFLREDGTWAEPSYTTNTDKTGIKLTTVSGTKKTDATVIITDSSTGLSIAGGTNKFLIGDGTNYIEVPVTPSITNNVTGSGTSGNLVKWNGTNSITNGPALSSAISTQTQSTKFLREDGTWQAPSYTTDTVRPIYTGGTSRYDSATKTGINFVGDGATSVTFLAAGTASNQSGDAAYGTIKISSNNDLVKFSTVANATTEYYLPVRAKNTTDTAQQLYRTGIIVKGSTITADLVGNANTATNLSKSSSRGYLYQSGNTTTETTGVGSVTAQTEIGIPYIGYDGSANTYGIYKDLFYLSGTAKCININVHGVRFAEVKTQNSTTDDWDGSTTSGTPTGGATSYTAGPGISISNGVISTTRKEYFLTEAQFDALTTLDSEAVYYIKAE